jgi:P4 family phage/plasmid primase-like protien
MGKKQPILGDTSSAVFNRTSHLNEHYSAHQNGHAPRARKRAAIESEPYAAPANDRCVVLDGADRVVLIIDSNISIEAIDARGYYTATEPQQLTDIGFDGNLAPALVIPLWNWRGDVCGVIIKPRVPRTDTSKGSAKPIKYECAPGVPPALDVSPLTREQINDPTKPLIITEGAKKADSAASRGLCAINLNGVYGFRGRNDKGGMTALPDWENIALNGRSVYIVFDSDVTTKPQVESAMKRLYSFLQSRKAILKVVYLPEGEGGTKTGLDDFFARGGETHQLFDLCRELRPISESRQAASQTTLDYYTARSEPSLFPSADASQIPAPILTTDRGTLEYDPAQIVALLRPGWDIVALTTQAAHAWRISHYLRDDLLYCKEIGWLRYNGSYWERDDKRGAKAASLAASLSLIVRQESAALFRHAATLAEAGRGTDSAAMAHSAKELLTHAKQTEGAAFIEAALFLASDKLSVPVSTFEQTPFLLGCEGGTWCEGEWREHRRVDYLTSLCPVAPSTTSTGEWKSVLNRITAGDADLAKSLQDACGYILSGASHLSLIPFLYGPRGTGKSTLAELCQTVLGEMAVTIDPALLHDDAKRERLGAALWNKRLAVCSEAGSQRIEAETLKTLSGADRIPVRFMRRESFTAMPRHVLLMVANDPPKMDAYDEALKRRITAYPLVHALDNGPHLRFHDGARLELVRQNCGATLVREFLTWAVDGMARVWRKQSLHRAACLDAATKQLWRDTDPLTAFWETFETGELEAGISKAALRTRYEDWCQAEGARPFNRALWFRACSSFGLIESKNNSVRMWRKLSSNGTHGTQLPMFPNNRCEQASEYGQL